MRRLLFISFLFLFCCTKEIFAQGENFSVKRIVNANTVAGRLRHPFAMVMGPDDSLWITERRGFVIRMDPASGAKTTLLNIAGLVRFTTTGGGTGIAQDGMFGIALHPELNKGTGNDYVYLAYCYDSSGKRRTKIVRYNYNRSVPSLTGEVTLLKGIPASNDHNSGRLIIGNVGTVAVPDYKLFYTVGDQGANQFANACDTIQSQYTPTAAQMTAGNVIRYCGKILRLNLDGSIPSDNPFFNGVQTHIYSIGHRNPQGLAFERNTNGTLKAGGKLFSSEQGPATDDEVNIIVSGKNYGWPRVAGYLDNVWYKYYSWFNGGSCGSYSGECSSNMTSSGWAESTFSSPDFVPPILSMFPGIPPGGTSCNWLTNPTVAPSSILFYPYSDKIAGWQNSLLIPTLKISAMLRVRLNASLTAVLPGTDTLMYFKTSELNRLRDIALSADGLKIYILTDSVGATSGPTAGVDGGVTNRGAVLEYRYLGEVLAVRNDPTIVRPERVRFTVYPNPATQNVLVECNQNITKPLTYQLYDATGKILLTGTSIKDKFSINTSSLQKGVYLLKIYNRYDMNIAVEKLMVN